jgi:hypothetical protein
MKDLSINFGYMVKGADGAYLRDENGSLRKYHGICERRIGCDMRALPEADGLIHWEISQKAGKYTPKGWTFSAYSRYEKQGTCETIEEARGILQGLYQELVGVK